MADLLPCPFCGGSPTVEKTAEDWGPPDDYFIACDCGANGPKDEVEAEAIAAWNRRAAPSDDAKQLQADTNEVLALAKAADLPNVAVNWSDLSCVLAVVGVDSEGKRFCGVWIEEADPGAGALKRFVRERLPDRWGDVEVTCEW